jgi:hypothetical protein
MKTVRWQRILATLGLLICTSIVFGFSCNTNPPATWGAIQFQIYTGSDDLDGGKSTGVGFLKLVNGTVIGCTLNTNPPAAIGNELPVIPGLGAGSNASFGGDSVNTATCSLVAANVKGTSVTPADVAGANVWVSLFQKQCETFCDNWNVEGLKVTLLQNNDPLNPGTTSCQLKTGFWGPGDQGDSPAIARLKGSNATLIIRADSPTSAIPQVCVGG